jgi:HEAT repeat protein
LEGFDASRVPAAFPIKQAFAVAYLASERKAANLPRLIEALGDASEPVRWWAAQGCAMLGTNAAAAAPALRRCSSDQSGAVQVAAAEAMARLGRVDEALPVLERVLKQTGNDAFALQAANVLDRLGESARPALPVVKSVFASVSKAERGASSDSESARSQNRYSGYLIRVLQHVSDVLESREQALVYPESLSSNPK